MKRRKVAYFHFVGWGALNLGVSLSLSCPNIEIHVPFGFFRFGWVQTSGTRPMNFNDRSRYTFGYEEKPWERAA